MAQEQPQQLARTKSKHREPPPTLFLHPSPAASHVSLPGIFTPGIVPGSQPQAGNALPASQQAGSYSQRNAPSLLRRPDGSAQGPAPGAAAAPAASIVDAHRASHAGHAHSLRATNPRLPINLVTGLPQPPTLRHGGESSTRATDRTDALWAEMQATLEEVELSAGGGTRVFGPDHDRKLAELRAAQIALAQAWARSEAEEAGAEAGPEGSGGAEVRNLKTAAGGGGAAATASGEGDAGATDAAKSTAGTGSAARPGSSGAGGERLAPKLEEETEVDILLARKRREANDRYFQRVNQGVLDVVAKLEEVAVAMRAVEQESKDIWGENEIEKESVASTKAGA